MKLLGEIRGSQEQGFTFIELLVAGAVLIVLVAVAVVGYSRFFGMADAEAGAAELKDVQTAMHAMMAANRIGSVEPRTIPTDDFFELPKGAGSEFLAPEFLWVGRASSFAKCGYTWDVHGVVKQADCASGGQVGGADLVNLRELRGHWEEIKKGEVLNQGQTNLFDSKLKAAQTALDKGDIAGAMHVLQTFINHVNAFINSGQLTEEQGQPLIQVGSQAIIRLGNQS